MNLHRSLLLFVLLVSATPAPAADKPASAGWYDLLQPAQRGTYPMYRHPVVAKGKEGETTYSQQAHFDAFTGLPRSFTVTLARDPAFKKQHSKESLERSGAKTLEIGKHTAWVWSNNRAESKVVVPLAEDIAVIVETDPVSEPMPVVVYAKSLDLDRIAKALANPPRTDFTPTPDTFRAIKKGDSNRGLGEWVGPMKSREQVGAKEDERYRWTYELKDGSKVFVLVAKTKIETITHETADGKTVELVK